MKTDEIMTLADAYATERFMAASMPRIHILQHARVEAKAREALRTAIEGLAKHNTYGWLIACDDALICSHLGVAELSHSYDYAKFKLNELIDWHISVATEPSLGATVVRKPLTEQQIYALASAATDEEGFSEVAFARAVEAAHNIRS